MSIQEKTPIQPEIPKRLDGIVSARITIFQGHFDLSWTRNSNITVLTRTSVNDPFVFGHDGRCDSLFEWGKHRVPSIERNRAFLLVTHNPEKHYFESLATARPKTIPHSISFETRPTDIYTRLDVDGDETLQSLDFQFQENPIETYWQITDSLLTLINIRLQEIPIVIPDPRQITQFTTKF